MKKFLFIIILLGLCSTAWATDYTAYDSCKLALLLDEASGSYTDSSATGASVTRSGGTMNATGQFDKAYVTDTSNVNQLTIDNAATDDFSELTIVAWMKPNTGGPLISKGTGTTTGKRIYNDAGIFVRFYVGASTSAGQAIAYSGMGANYTHCAFTYSNSGDRKPYVFFGGSAASYYSGYPTAASGTIGADNGSVIEIGTSYANGQTCATEYYDEVAYFNAVLSSTEINDIMDNGLVGSAGGGTIQNIRNAIGSGLGTGIGNGMR